MTLTLRARRRPALQSGQSQSLGSSVVRSQSGSRGHPRAPLSPPACLVAALTAAVLLAGCSKKPVATVNGSPITEEEFADRCASFLASSNPQGQSVGFLVLDNLITLRILEKELERLKQLPSEADVNRRLEAVKKQLAFMGQPVEQQLRMQGRPEEALKRDLRDAMVEQSFRSKDIKVSDQEARQYYETHRDAAEWSQKERIRVSQIIVLSRQDLDRAMNELKSNAKFSDVARAVSKDQWAQRGGSVPHWFTRDELQSTNLPLPQPALLKAFDLQPGQFSDPPIHVSGDPRDPTKSAWVIVRLDEKKPAETMPFEDAKELVIWKARMEKSLPKQNEMSHAFGKLLKEADIEVNRPEWQDLVKQLKQRGEAIASNTGAGAPPGPTP
jgi:parvulin-like peptidyl-prolyl isomerase